MAQTDKVLYTAKTRTTGGREGASRSEDGHLDVQLTTPGTAGTPGTNPEQLFAAAYSACFIGAMQTVAGKMGARLPDDTAVDAEVDLCDLPDGAYRIAVRLQVHLPGMERGEAQKVLDAAGKIWPYAHGSRDTIGMALTLA
ncbi:MAG: Ohr family peroxiredoxin [Giesbergeria sp.]|nr:Ohr family peroxiredoxin [Giesbergeria sp.]